MAIEAPRSMPAVSQASRSRSAGRAWSRGPERTRPMSVTIPVNMGSGDFPYRSHRSSPTGLDRQAPESRRVGQSRQGEGADGRPALPAQQDRRPEPLEPGRPDRRCRKLAATCPPPSIIRFKPHGPDRRLAEPFGEPPVKVRVQGRQNRLRIRSTLILGHLNHGDPSVSQTVVWILHRDDHGRQAMGLADQLAVQRQALAAVEHDPHRLEARRSRAAARSARDHRRWPSRPRPGSPDAGPGCRCTSSRASGPVIQRLSPEAVAMRPSREVANLSVTPKLSPPGLRTGLRR
jgi:hypothetical protein